MEINKFINKKATPEVSIFLWKNFRDYTQKKISELINAQDSYVELRENGKLIGIGFIEGDFLSFSAIDEDYRGKSLQLILIKERLSILKKVKGFTFAFVNVRCKNIPSLKNLLKAKFEIVKTIRYGNDDLGYEMQKTL